MRVLFSHFHVSCWKFISSPEHFWDLDTPYWSFPRDGQQQSQSSYLFSERLSFLWLAFQTPRQDKLAQIYQCTVQFTLHHLRVYTSWILDSWLVLLKFLLKCWCSWHGSYAHSTIWSVHAEGYVSRTCPCFKKCIFRETAWAALRTSIAGIVISTDLKNFSSLWQNRGKHR